MLGKIMFQELMDSTHEKISVLLNRIRLKRLMRTPLLLLDLIKHYFHTRGLKNPQAKDAAIFLATEVGELLDALMRQELGWVRNNTKDTDPASELADCLMMTMICADALGVDVFETLETKLEAKLAEIYDQRRNDELDTP